MALRILCGLPTGLTRAREAGGVQACAQLPKTDKGSQSAPISLLETHTSALWITTIRCSSASLNGQDWS